MCLILLTEVADRKSLIYGVQSVNGIRMHLQSSGFCSKVSKVQGKEMLLVLNARRTKLFICTSLLIRIVLLMFLIFFPEILFQILMTERQSIFMYELTPMFR